jgi:hypothetical protein
MIRRAASSVIPGIVLLAAAPVLAAESPAELISTFRLKHGEVRVMRDATLSALLRLRRHVYSQDDRAIAFSSALYRSDLYQFSVMLSRR